MERVDNSIVSCTDCTEHVNVYAKTCITLMKENEELRARVRVAEAAADAHRYMR